MVKAPVWTVVVLLGHGTSADSASSVPAQKAQGGHETNTPREVTTATPTAWLCQVKPMVGTMGADDLTILIG